MDSGVCMLSSHRPLQTGFRRYEGSANNEEALVGKGMVWGYWEIGNTATVVIATHLGTKGLQYKHITQLPDLVQSLHKRFGSGRDLPRFELFVTGDFNIEGDHNCLKNFCKETGLTMLSNG